MSRLDAWSRRKALVAAEAEADAARAAAERAAAREAALAERSDAELLEQAGLPDPDTLEPGADFSAYLKAALPAHLKRRALRRLWATNPALGAVDGLVDYGEDFTEVGRPAGLIATAYKVGRGLIGGDDAAAAPAPDAAPAPPPAKVPPADEAQPATPPAAEIADSDDTASPDPAFPDPASYDPEPFDPAPSPPRRMRIRYDTA